MPLPIAAILSAIAPLALSALEQYRQRQQAKTAEAGDPVTGEALRDRLHDLEESDLEQSRLLGELSRGLESLANAFAATVEESRRQQLRLQQMLWGACGLAVVSLGLSIWAVTR